MLDSTHAKLTLEDVPHDRQLHFLWLVVCIPGRGNAHSLQLGAVVVFVTHGAQNLHSLVVVQAASHCNIKDHTIRVRLFV